MKRYGAWSNPTKSESRTSGNPHLRAQCLIAGSPQKQAKDMAAADLSEFETRLLKWLAASDFEEVPWSTKRAAEAFKVDEKSVYEALSSLTVKVPHNIQIYYEDSAIRIVASDEF